MRITNEARPVSQSLYPITNRVFLVYAMSENGLTKAGQSNA